MLQGTHGASTLLLLVCMACAAPEASIGDEAVEAEASLSSTSAAAVALSAAPGKCLDVRGGSATRGTVVQLYDCNGSAAQAWSLAGGTVRALGKCLDVRDGRTTNGASLQLWDCGASNPNQQWVAREGTLMWAGRNKCVDVPAGHTVNGTPLQLWDCLLGNPNQRWDLGPLTRPPTTSAGCKRGIAFGQHSVADMRALSGAVSWWYNWSPKPDNAAVTAAYRALKMQFVPMVWNGSFTPGGVQAAMPADVAVLLTFNEPNFHVQANLTPERAAALWPKIEQIARSRGMKIASPALNFCGGGCNETDPFVWFDKFFAACRGCQVDYLAVHWYACTKEALTWYLNKMETRYKRPLWLTEFSCLDAANVSVPV
ncbi:MAG TPA: glycosyl hydrolase, partial [Myxococcota bacterium]|nr:glycosyl hydrolase [Myxococcota bacterium]